MTRGLVVTLLEPVVVSAQAATASRMQTLTYLPGATFLGIAASKLYGSLGRQGVFHSGEVRFEDAFPLQDSGHICLPAPMSLHRKKEASLSKVTENVCDFATCARKPNYKQIRGTDIVLDGEARFYTPRRMASLRTAIDFETGLADEGQFYGYEALAPGQRFRTRIVGDDDDRVSKIVDALCGEHFIGRSKTAEFGRVIIEAERDAASWSLTADGSGVGKRFVWFLSDAWLYDRYGLPTARPEAEIFREKATHNTVEIDWAHSFARTRHAAPYNAKWRARAEERELITRGSVLTLLNCDLKPGLCTFGMGQERGYGLAFVSEKPLKEVFSGQAVNPPELGDVGVFHAETIGDVTEFSEWLKSKMKRVQESKIFANEDDLKSLQNCYKAARRLAGEPVGPSASQWARLATCLVDDIPLDSLLGPSEDRDSTLWGARFDVGEGEQGTFRGFVRDFLNAGESVRLRHLAQKARRAIEAENWLVPQGVEPETGSGNDNSP